MRTAIFSALAVVCITASMAPANSLNLEQRPPDIYSNYILVNYTAATKDFTASGFSFTFDLDGNSPPDYNIVDGMNYPGGTWDITAKIDNNGDPLSGSLTITGYIPSLLGSQGTGTLLTGTLSEFGFPNAGGDPLEFVFTNIGGDLAQYYDGANVVLQYTGFQGSFQNDFGNYGLGQSDTFVPEPVTCVTLLGALGALGGYVRRRAKQAMK